MSEGQRCDLCVRRAIFFMGDAARCYQHEAVIPRQREVIELDLRDAQTALALAEYEAWGVTQRT